MLSRASFLPASVRKFLGREEDRPQQHRLQKSPSGIEVGANSPFNALLSARGSRRSSACSAATPPSTPPASAISAAARMRAQLDGRRARLLAIRNRGEQHGMSFDSPINQLKGSSFDPDDDKVARKQRRSASLDDGILVQQRARDWRSNDIVVAQVALLKAPCHAKIAHQDIMAMVAMINEESGRGH